MKMQHNFAEVNIEGKSCNEAWLKLIRSFHTGSINLASKGLYLVSTTKSCAIN